MPHAGLMDADALGPVRAALQRSRLHLRGGKRRLRQGKVSAGLVTLYDALLFAMEWFSLGPGAATLPPAPGGAGGDDAGAYRRLVAAGVLDGAFDFEAFDRLVVEALDRDLPADFPWETLAAGIDGVMTALGVMPFNETALPPEDPATY